MRCFSCEPLLDAYLERELPPRTMRVVADHLRHCPSCTATLAELRVVDGLLATTRPVALPANFAFAAMTHVRSLPKPRRTAGALWIVLAFYVVCAWIAVWVATVALRGGAPVLGTGLFESSITDAVHAGPWEAAIGTMRAFSPLTPLVVPALATALVLDVALAAGVLFFYREIRPWLAARLSEREA
jgi:predicted anti-sigma-YlaC factor YlaD